MKRHTLQLLPVFTLSGRIGKMVASHAEVARSSPAGCTDLYYARGAHTVLPMKVGDATSQLDLLSLTPLSVAVVVDCNQEFPIGLLQYITASS